MNEISFVINGCAEVVTGEGSHVFPRQTHRSYIFGTLISGAEVIRIGDRSAGLVPGDCYILPPDTPIEMYPEGRSGYISLCLKGRLAELIGGCRPDGFFAKNKGGALLRQTERQSDVAFDLSFSSQSHLESVFAKNMGLTLGQYRASVTIRRD